LVQIAKDNGKGENGKHHEDKNKGKLIIKEIQTRRNF
jgi:hypothetical protein